MKLIEQAVRAVDNGPVSSEDGIVVHEDNVMVIDGKSNVTDVPWNEKTSGRLAMEILTLTFKHVTDTEDAFTLLSQLNDYLPEYNPVRAENDPLQASVILYQGSKHRIIAYGHVQCLINGKHYVFTGPDMDEKPLDMSGMHIIEVKEGDEVVLATDGYDNLKETLALSEETFVNRERIDDCGYVRFIA